MSAEEMVCDLMRMLETTEAEIEDDCGWIYDPLTGGILLSWEGLDDLGSLWRAAHLLAVGIPLVCC